MRLLKSLFSASIGKKQFVALTGLLLIGFLGSHLAGNLLMYAGAEEFNTYAEFLGSHPLLIPAEIGLAALFFAHIFSSLRVTYENWAARPVGYSVHVSAGGRTIGSRTMKYTGLMTMVFLLVHIYTFKLSHPEGTTLFDWVVYNFKTPWYMGFYLLAMISLGVHLSHGVKSAFQTFGLEHPKYTPIVNAVGLGLAIALAIGFGSLPLWGFLRGGS